MESNDSPEIPDRRETSDIPGLPSGVLSEDGQFLIFRALVKGIVSLKKNHEFPFLRLIGFFKSKRLVS